ncbi:type IV pilin [Halorhabdus sp. CUG00001]|uniref:type IV pilin n=1 Tax=Halorhabdus sp. CUG00001 TaxID=2600297 RepID=UPI00131C4076|nr:type IV pilin [Halorhabdus sp. CUG00001]
MGAPESDDRAISEMLAVVTLVGMALLLVVGIGLNVLLLAPSDSSGPSANFTFRYVEQNSALIVTHEEGDALPAGDVYVDGQEGNVTWAALAGWEDSRLIEEGDIVQVAEGGAYGEPVRQSDQLSIVWWNASANGTAELDRWTGTDGV